MKTWLKNMTPAICILALVFLYNFLTYFNHSVVGGMDVLNNSDSMYLPSLFQDLIINDGVYKNWYLTPAPYFFPDMALYFAVSLINSKVYISNYLFFNVQLLVLFIFIYKINEFHFKKERAAIYAAISISLLFCIEAPAAPYLIRSGHHFGVLLSAIVLLFLMLKAFKQKKMSFLNCILILIISVLTVASDKLYLVQAIAPIIGALFLLLIIRAVPVKLVLQITAVLCFSVILGYLLHDVLVLNETQYPISFSFENIELNWTVLTSNVVDTLSKNWLVSIYILLFYLVTIVALTYRLLCRQIVSNPMSSFVMLFVMGSVGLMFGVMLPSSLAMMNRYLMPFYFLPLIFFPLLMNIFGGLKNNNLFYYLKIVGIFLLLLLVNVNAVKGFKYKEEYYPGYIECIDKFVKRLNANSGIGNYWQSKSLNMLSKVDLNIVQVTDNFSEYNWITTSSWREQTYRLLIVNNGIKPEIQPNPERLKKQFGIEPQLSTQCGRYELFFYFDGFTLL